MVAERIGGVEGREVARAYLHGGRRISEGTKNEIPESPEALPTGVVVHNSGSAAAWAHDARGPGEEEASASREAEKVCREHLLRQWVKRVNEESGLTPNTIQVWERWRAEADTASAGSGPPGATSPLCRRAVQWVRRWRRRWQVRRAKAKAVSVLSMADLRLKAVSRSARGVRENRSRGDGPEKTAAEIRPQKSGHHDIFP